MCYRKMIYILWCNTLSASNPFVYNFSHRRKIQGSFVSKNDATSKISRISELLLSHKFSIYNVSKLPKLRQFSIFLLDIKTFIHKGNLKFVINEKIRIQKQMCARVDQVPSALQVIVFVPTLPSLH